MANIWLSTIEGYCDPFYKLHHYLLKYSDTPLHRSAPLLCKPVKRGLSVNIIAYNYFCLSVPKPLQNLVFSKLK